MEIPQTEAELQRYVTERIQESERLEFKRELPASGKNEDIAKDVSSLANTDGGLIVYGVDAKSGVPEQLTPMAVAGTVERISLVARSSIDEPIQIAGIVTIPAASPGMGFVVVPVSRSPRAPHFVRGAAWGRFGSTNGTLTRHRIGELFARGEGFAEEFGLALRRPGRVLVTTERVPLGGDRMVSDDVVVFKNDGDSVVHDVNWEFTELAGGSAPSFGENPFPLPVMEPGQEVNVHIWSAVNDVAVPKIRVRWVDTNGTVRDGVWPLTWA